MFFRAALAFLAIGALSVNAFTVPVARSPVPEPECEFPRSFSITSYHDLTLAPTTDQELEAWMLKRDLSYDLFSREPEDWAQWAKRSPPNIRIDKFEPAPSPRPPTPNPSTQKITDSLGRDRTDTWYKDNKGNKSNKGRKA